ncbi:MAG: hypothetical protein EXR03_06065 [Pseudolabrys sp.]|nr:hypothetical protein [Pseudolabrys sp.]MSP32373.1 hypothetical protein [Pseudolabrys sp.]
MAAVLVVAALFVNYATLPAAAAPSIDELFHEFGLFGNWAADCKQPATPANPHVGIAMPSPGLVLEEHDLGADFARNRYSVLSAERISATSLSVAVIFQPGAQAEERQTLVFLIRKATRRTMFNRPDGGAVRVKDGIALARGSKTPVLRKCG